MKHFSLLITILMFSLLSYSQSTREGYYYIDTHIDSKTLLKNLRYYAQDYVKFKKWDEGRAREFYDALEQYEKAIEEGRISSVQSGALSDAQGLLNDGTSNWRDKDGNVITQEAYDALSKRKKKKYTNTFYPNREVARYINDFARKIYDLQTKQNSPEYKRDAGILDSFRSSGVK